MSDKLMEKAQKKLKEGWIKSLMMIEVLAISEEAAKSSLENHVKKMGREKKTIVYKKEFKEIVRVENPLPPIKEAYSNVVELELVTENFETLVFLVMTYAPSSVEILEPVALNLEVGEAQGILNSIAEMLHRFASAGLGGVVINA